MEFVISKVKYLVLASLGFLVMASPVYATANPTATRANELKMRSCEVREKAVETRMEYVLRMASNMLEVFENINLRVAEFYQEKVVAKGLTVSDYDSLVEEINTNKGAVRTALDQAEGTAESFDCDSGNAKDTVIQFRKDMQGVKESLRQYRTSIKNLIVAVRTVHKNLESTPKPTQPLE